MLADRHLHTPKQPFNFKYHPHFLPYPTFSGCVRPFPAIFLRFPEHWSSPMQGVTAEYGPARAQKNQTGKWYPQIPVDHTTLQINQRVVNTTLIPVSEWATLGRKVARATSRPSLLTLVVRANFVPPTATQSRALHVCPRAARPTLLSSGKPTMQVGRRECRRMSPGLGIPTPNPESRFP